MLSRVILVLFAAACSARDPGDAGLRDGAIDGAVLDGAAIDGGPLEIDAGTQSDAGSDAGETTIDAGSMDGGRDDAGLEDAGMMDAGFDAGHVDAGHVDAGRDAGMITIDAGTPPPPGLSVPCSSGPGWTLFRFHYDGSTSPRVDVWDATCSYSYAPGSACNVVDVYGALVMGGYAMGLDGSDYIRVRFSVAGLSFSEAAVYVQARSYSTSASTNIRVWSPIYGDQAMGPVDNDFTYDWYGMDWTDFLDPGDSPGLTAIQIYPYLGSGSLAVHAVELCVQ